MPLPAPLLLLALARSKRRAWHKYHRHHHHHHNHATDCAVRRLGIDGQGKQWGYVCVGPSGRDMPVLGHKSREPSDLT